MAWVRIDDQFDEHPKLQRVGPIGWGFWLAGLAYCNRNLTDGFIPWTKARTLCSFEIADESGVLWELGRNSGYAGEEITAEWVIGLLIEAGLWEEVTNGKGRIDGYQVHDYDHYQPTREKVEEDRAKKVAAGQAGGQASAQARAQAKSNPKPKPKPVPKPNPVPGPFFDAPDKPTRTATRATAMPDDFVPPYEWAATELGMDVAVVDRHVACMRDWAASKGETRKDWTAFARNWLRKAAHDQPARASPNGASTKTSRYHADMAKLHAIIERGDE